jgi:hypothetical protein
VSALDARTGVVLRTVALGNVPYVVHADARSGRIFVIDDGNTLSVLDATRGASRTRPRRAAPVRWPWTSGPAVSLWSALSVISAPVRCSCWTAAAGRVADRHHGRGGGVWGGGGRQHPPGLHPRP